MTSNIAELNNIDWAIFVRVENLIRLGEIRRQSDHILAGLEDKRIWLRGHGGSAGLRAELLSVADSPIFRVNDNRWLFPAGSRVPTLELPDIKWVSLSSMLTFCLPTTHYPSARIHRAKLSLVRGGSETQANVVLGTWDAFRNWAEAAPLVRLTACYFSASRAYATEGNEGRSARVIVAGNPLPPIAGDRFYLVGRVAVPLGFTWEPAVDVQTVEQVIQRSATVSDDQWDSVGLLIWNRGGQVDVVMKQQMIMALRQNIRATAARISDK